MPSERFLKFLPFIFKWECVFKKGHYGDMNYVTWENEEGDPGGVTKYGVDQRSHPKLDIKNLTKDAATSIYWNEYWNRNGCENFPTKLGEAYFNCCINAGAGRAKILLSRCKEKTAKEFINQQEKFYYSLVAEKPKFKKFLNGWCNRTQDLRKYLSA